ncbi:MAG: hypothetical protein Q8L89_06330 [Gammaproteobacteria bacterium]|nr:hypothetical protein [Gammaproteobacteria bacterium]
MKITAALPPSPAREHARPPANAATTGPSPQASDHNALPATAAGQQGQKATPPGLTAVQTRLQAIPEAGRNAGQTSALERINHNIARYLENQPSHSITADTETSLDVTG